MLKITVYTLVICSVASALTVEEHPKYQFQYAVQNDKTGDHKAQWEYRDGDHLAGSYTLLEADGSQRVVDYQSNFKHGFQAHVKRNGHGKHPYGAESYANIDQKF